MPRSHAGIEAYMHQTVGVQVTSVGESVDVSVTLSRRTQVGYCKSYMDSLLVKLHMQGVAIHL
jgi:hypothetical protein